MINLLFHSDASANDPKEANGKDVVKGDKKSPEKSNERKGANSEKDGAVDFDQALDYEAMDAGHSDNEADAKEETSTRNNDHRGKQRDAAESSDDSSGQGIKEESRIEYEEANVICITGLGSDTLEKLRGRSRSELPSPESEDISRRRDSRKDQRQAISGLSSLAKIYADDETTDNNKQGSSPKAEGEATLSTDAAASHAKDDNQAKIESAKETLEKEKDKQRVSLTPLLFTVPPNLESKNVLRINSRSFRTAVGVVREKGAIRTDVDIEADHVIVRGHAIDRAEIAIIEEVADEVARDRTNGDVDNSRFFSHC